MHPKQLFSSIAFMAVASCGLADEWGTVCGRIVYDGVPPTPAKIKVDKDVEVCGKYDLVDESLIVNRQNRGVRDVVVMLALGRGESITPHPSYEASATESVLLDNKCCRFDPHVTVMRTTQQLRLHNSDPKGDSVRIETSKNTAINITMPPGTEHFQAFPLVERLPVRVSCGIHPWELGWLVIAEHPYVAVTDADGRFEIRHLPIGRRNLMFWQERSGYVDQVIRQGIRESWRRGTREIDVQSGLNDLGEIVVPASVFEK